MELKTPHIVNRESKSIDFLLYGIIGEKIDGDYFANELDWAGKNYDTILLRINSDGGDVSQGLSIVSAMVASSAMIVTRVEGVAASMSAVIAVAGDRVEMNDYAQLMVHDPYFIDENGKAIASLDARQKKAMQRCKNQLVSILTRRGKSSDDISALMKKESWFTAEEAKTAGLVDEVINTGRKAEMANLTPLKLVAKLLSEQTETNSNNMKLIAKALGMAESATENEIVNKINDQNTALKAREDAVAAREKKIVDTAIARAKACGKVTDANEAKMRRLAESDMELFEELTAGEATEQKPVDKTRVSDLVNQSKTKTDAANEKTWDWYQKNDPSALAAMETADKVRFERLRNAYESSLV
jgi:ATP-dependent protease ClpP protease subunit